VWKLRFCHRREIKLTRLLCQSAYQYRCSAFRHSWIPPLWPSARFFSRVEVVDFSRWGKATVVKFHFINSKTREKHFSTKKFIEKYEISKCRGGLGSSVHLTLDAHDYSKVLQLLHLSQCNAANLRRTLPWVLFLLNDNCLHLTFLFFKDDAFKVWGM